MSDLTHEDFGMDEASFNDLLNWPHLMAAQLDILLRTKIGESLANIRRVEEIEEGSRMDNLVKEAEEHAAKAEFLAAKLRDLGDRLIAAVQ